MTEPRTELERVYDDQISPLMTQIIAICKEHKMPMLADFWIGFDEEVEEDLKCTTALLSDGFNPPENMLKALRILRTPPTFMAFTVTTSPKSTGEA